MTETSPAARRAAAFRALREAHATETAEDYVELIGDLIAETGEARLTDLADHMGVSQPTAAKIVARLKSLGLVESRPYRSLFLTSTGADMARRSRERHQVVVAFLSALGVSAATAEIDSEGLEHHVSEETLEVFRAGQRGCKLLRSWAVIETPVLPPLIDNPGAPELFVAFPVGFSLVGPIVTLTFEAPRVDYASQPNVIARHVVARLTTSVAGAQALVLQLNAYLEAQGHSPSKALAAGCQPQ